MEIIEYISGIIMNNITIEVYKDIEDDVINFRNKDKKFYKDEIKLEINTIYRKPRENKNVKFNYKK